MTPRVEVFAGVLVTTLGLLVLAHRYFWDREREADGDLPRWQTSRRGVRTVVRIVHLVRPAIALVIGLGLLGRGLLRWFAG